MKRLLLLASLALSLGACQAIMSDQPRYESYEESEFFADGMSMRPPVAGTVARGRLRRSFDEVARGRAVDMALLKRGQELYAIHCMVCHGATGQGNGIVTQRGFSRPSTFHQDRLRQVGDAHFYNVITNGFGRMFRMGDRISPEERWAIVAYVRALQLSQDVALADLSPAERERVARPPERDLKSGNEGSDR